MANDAASVDAYYLGLDLGTSSIKAIIIDSMGAVVAEAAASYPTARPHIGWSEQDPADWCRAIEIVVGKLREAAGGTFGRLGAVGFCSAAHLPVLLDGEGEVVRPAILWNDQRSLVEARELDVEVGGLIRERTLNNPSCTWTLPQLIWIARHEPQSMARARTLLSSKDYIVSLLTGVLSMDVTSAAATLVYDVESGCWSPELMARSGLPESAFPKVIPASATIGLVGQGTRTFGLPEGLPVVSGCLDTAAELVACGIKRAEDGVVVRVGSSGALLAIGQKAFVPGVLNYPLAVGEGHYLQAGTNSGAISMQWIRDVGNAARLGVDEIDFQELDRIVAQTKFCSDGIIFHPYLQGERAPYWNPKMRASFSGINNSHSWPDFVRAVMEGVAFSLRDCLGAVQVAGIRTDSLKLVGGVTRSPVWSQILADVLENRLEIVEYAESSIGAAMIARFAIEGVYPESRISTVIEPLNEASMVYSELFSRYRALAIFMNETSNNT
jgi:xylulokinase